MSAQRFGYTSVIRTYKCRLKLSHRLFRKRISVHRKVIFDIRSTRNFTKRIHIRQQHSTPPPPPSSPLPPPSTQSSNRQMNKWKMENKLSLISTLNTCTLHPGSQLCRSIPKDWYTSTPIANVAISSLFFLVILLHLFSRRLNLPHTATWREKEKEHLKYITICVRLPSRSFMCTECLRVCLGFAVSCLPHFRLCDLSIWCVHVCMCVVWCRR